MIFTFHRVHISPIYVQLEKNQEGNTILLAELAAGVFRMTIISKHSRRTKVVDTWHLLGGERFCAFVAAAFVHPR